MLGLFHHPGGDRIGVAGTKGASGFAVVTSLNLRVARWVTCEIPADILRQLSTLTGGNPCCRRLPEVGKLLFFAV